ncbi:MAG: hypothetical protein AAF702_30695 [Chloroflexota bacterium]
MKFAAKYSIAVPVLALWLMGMMIAAPAALAQGDVIFDFNSSNGIPLERGQIVSSISNGGITMDIDVQSNGAHDVAMIFDTKNPGPDPDLGAPNEACPGGGPGVGPGGAPNTIGENCEMLGNVLIIPNNVSPGAPPNDDSRGGVVTLTFSELVQVIRIDLLDIDEENTAPRIEFLDVGGQPTQEPLTPRIVGNNGHEQFSNFDPNAAANISAIRFTFPGSGALDKIVVRPAQPVGGIEIRKFVNGQDANDPLGPDVPEVEPGTAVTWTYRVTNTGQIAYPIADVNVTDSDPNVTPIFNQILIGNSDAQLEPGEVWEYVANGIMPDPLTPENPSVIENLCPPAQGTSGPRRTGYRNIGTVRVPGDTDEDPAHICEPPNPGIAIRKFVNGFDANDPQGPDVPDVEPGTAVTWTYRVTNTGEIAYPIAQVSVTDSDPTVTPAFNQVLIGNADNQLEPGEVWEYIANGIMPDPLTPENPSVIENLCPPAQGTSGPQRAGYRNIGTVTVPGDTDEDLAHICEPPNPGIAIRKFVNGFDANDPLGPDVPEVEPGTAVTWTYRVINTGEIAFPDTQVNVTDSDPNVTPAFNQVLIGNADNQLEPGEVWEYIANGIMPDPLTPENPSVIENLCPPAQGTSGPQRTGYRNIGTVTVPGDTDEDPAHICEPPNPGIAIRKFVNGFDANDPLGPDVPEVEPGTAVTWTYRVTNTGEIAYPIAQVSVTDSDPNVTPAFNQVLIGNADAQLEPGEVWEYIANGIMPAPLTANNPSVVENLCPPAQGTSGPRRTGYRNIGTVMVPDGTDSDPAHICEPPNPGIAIRKFVNGFDANDPLGADVPEVEPGAAVTWTYRVTNTGEIAYSFAQVNVTDSDPNVTPIFNQVLVGNADEQLEPGEVWEYIANGIMPDPLDRDHPAIVDDLCPPANDGTGPKRRGYQNIGTVRVEGLSDSDPAHICPVPQRGIRIRKFVNGADANNPDGSDAPTLVLTETVTWTYLVTNTGEVAIPNTEIVVSDNDSNVTPAFNQVRLGNNDDQLDPGEVWEYIATLAASNIELSHSSPLIIPNGCAGDGTNPPSDSYRNIGTVTIPGATDSDPAQLCLPGPDLAAGRIDSYSLFYTVVNDGAIAVENVRLLAGSYVTVDCPKDTLAPNESMKCAATATDIAFRNSIGWVIATPVGGGLPIIRVVHPDQVADFSVQITLGGEDASAPSGPSMALSPTELRIDVTNTGTVDLMDLQVSIPNLAVGCDAPTIAPGSTGGCSATVTPGLGPQIWMGTLSATPVNNGAEISQEVRIYGLGE